MGKGRSKEEMQGIDREIKAELRPGSRTAQCATCEAFFSGIAPFDRHLLGKGTGDVTCLTADGMRAIGMTQNTYKVWQYGLPLKVAQAA